MDRTFSKMGEIVNPFRNFSRYDRSVPRKPRRCARGEGAQHNKILAYREAPASGRGASLEIERGIKPAGVVLKSNPPLEERAFAEPKWLRPRRRGVISNGVKDQA